MRSSSPANEAREAAGRVFRQHSGRVLATLIRQLGDFDRAEDALQDAMTRALEVWSKRGIPDNPVAWLITTARHRAIDCIRRETSFASKADELRRSLAGEGAPEPDDADDLIPDDRLRLVFTACHPMLSLDARVALTLRTLGGLTTREIAHAFLVPEQTMAQRLVRAKRKIRLGGIAYEVPPKEKLAERLDAVLTVVYLVFNEGYQASEGDRLLRPDLANEALRLGRLLSSLLPDESEVWGLLALMLLHDARKAARTNGEGDLIVLEEQDRALWDRTGIVEGLQALDRAGELGQPGIYQIQAAIAALHVQAPSAAATDWSQIASLYELLWRATRSPIVALNRAVAIGMAEGPEEGLRRIGEIESSGALHDYYLLVAAKAEFLRRARRFSEALGQYDEALALVRNERERRYLLRRRSQVEPRVTR